MEILYAVLAIAVLFAIGWAMNKFSSLTAKGLNRTVLSFGEYSKGKQLREDITFKTTASVSDIMRQLDLYVTAVDAPLGGNQVLYIHEKREQLIMYVFGSASEIVFQANLAFTGAADGTNAILRVVRWQEEDGVTGHQEELRRLRSQVVAAFKAADPAVRIAEAPQTA